MHRVEWPTSCPENGALIWWIFWLENVVVGWMGLVMLSRSFLWTFEGPPELREPQPESVDDLSDGISSQNMTTRLSEVPANPSVTKFRFLDLDFRRTPDILKRPSGTSKLKKTSIHFTAVLFTFPCVQRHQTTLLILQWEGKKSFKSSAAKSFRF